MGIPLHGDFYSERPWMLWTLRKLYAWFAPKEKEKPPEQLIDVHLAKLRRASAGELAGTLAAAILAKKTVDTTRMVEAPFPEAHLDGSALIDEAARAQLIAYVSDLRRFRRICAESETILRMSVAKGLDTWMATISAIAVPGQIDKARELWRLLMQGEPTLEAAYRFMVRRAPTDVEMSYMTYRPALLMEPSAADQRS